ncbi:MAG: rod shape-determining protein MreC [Elusimicrobia bacterium]|nr:rod shape-determining protein MreC [Elusimicrobiota bacterium]
MQREKRLSNIFLFGFTSFSLICLLMPLSQPVQMVRLLLAYGFYPPILRGEESTKYLRSVPANFLGLLRTDQENRQLKEELKQKDLLRAELEGALEENDRYRKLLGFQPRLHHAGIWAQVMERDPIRWYRSVLVNRGAENGVVLNASVLAVEENRASLIGRIVEVRPNVSKLLLVTDELSSVAAYLKETHWEGLIEGKGGALLRLNYLPLDAQFKMGQEVLVSPTSAVFPQDISIGRVFRVLPRDPFLTFQVLEIKPTVSLEKLKEVFIIKRMGPRPPPPLPLGGRGDELKSGTESVSP